MFLLPFRKILIGNTSKCFILSIRHLMSKQLIYSEFGEPARVVKLEEREVPKLKNNEVMVRMLASPVNPSDINTIEGKYPVKIKLPMIPGNEGVGVVEEIGPNVKLKKCSKVIVTKPTLGTWRTHAVFNENVLKAVPDKLGLAEAATITVNPCAAYRMLTDYKPLKEKGLVVIQNGANSACGQNVIQICKAWGIRNINIIRDRDDAKTVKDFLKSIGATYVLVESELRKTKIFKTKEIKKPSLALNCVGGKNCSAMMRLLDHSGCVVTYGGMSRQPVTVPTSAFIFKNYQFYGFWLTKWNELADPAAKECMLNDIIEMMCAGKIKAPVHQMLKFDQYKVALEKALSKKGFGCAKFIFDFT